MIQAEEAIRAAREMIGTAYSELDCINLIKKVIRTAPGGDKNYTTAGTNDLWNSDGKSAKYRDLTWKQEGISGAKAGMLAFMGVGTGDVDHTGLVTERGTVLHSSKSRGCVVETELTEKRGWNGLGKHRMIAVDGEETADSSPCWRKKTAGCGWNIAALRAGSAGNIAVRSGRTKEEYKWTNLQKLSRLRAERCCRSSRDCRR